MRKEQRSVPGSGPPNAATRWCPPKHKQKVSLPDKSPEPTLSAATAATASPTTSAPNHKVGKAHVFHLGLAAPINDTNPNAAASKGGLNIPLELLKVFSHLGCSACGFIFVCACVFVLLVGECTAAVKGAQRSAATRARGGASRGRA